MGIIMQAVVLKLQEGWGYSGLGWSKESFIDLKWTLEEESDLTNWKGKCLESSE